MTEITITGADREWATAIRADLIRGSDGMPSYPVDIIPPIIAQIRHQARTEALEEAAKVADQYSASRRAASLHAKGRKKRTEARDFESMAIEGTHISIAIRALSRSGGA